MFGKHGDKAHIHTSPLNDELRGGLMYFRFYPAIKNLTQSRFIPEDFDDAKRLDHREMMTQSVNGI